MLERSRLYSSRFIGLLGATFAVTAAPVLAKDSVYSKSTVVVYNRNFPGSDTVASHYVTLRSIPSANLIALDCPPQEEITRAEYRNTIEVPLQRIFSDPDRKWWEVNQSGTQRSLKSNKIHMIVLAHGVPLKIKDSRPAEASETQAGKLATDAASVDTELALLGQFNERHEGPTPNPYFRKEVAFGDACLTDLMLVGRLDGPDVATCRRLIDDASDVERVGLWGRAYIDLAQKSNGGFALGENWLKAIISQCDRDGIPAVVDANPGTFPTHYPMSQAALYFGWYITDADGPLNNPDFQFVQGAVACHIHSYSATTLRTKTARWVGPLVHKGAAAALGNVYEPYLEFTTHLDLFFKRLLDGYTVAEAAYMATPSLSWMTVLVGDPLYRPFDGFRTYEPQFFRENERLHAKTYHIATRLWANESRKYEPNLEIAAKNHKTGFYDEALANRHRNANELNAAATFLETAKGRYLSAKDRLRVDLQIVDLERQRHNTKKALSLLRTMQTAREYEGLEELNAVTALIKRLSPPAGSGS